ncbi:MAG: adenine nucleotide alpha hydrolase family protein [Anaerolineales bacterium]|nr:adenine nucleotide alpha hydrolase family protein [Anaerolineales bacterium]
MKCVVCREKSVINLPQHNMSMCQLHFDAWILKRVEKTIRKYSIFNQKDTILVAVSGGKDSLTLWDILTRLGYHAEGFFIDLGIHKETDFSTNSRCRVSDFSNKFAGKIHWLDFTQEYGTNVPEMATRTQRGIGKPCSVCGIVKRHLMNRFAKENGYTVLATGHNLDDECAVLYSNLLGWKTGYLSRQAPVLESTGDGLIRKVKPLAELYEREIAAYAFLRGINYIREECPFSVDAKSHLYKHMLDILENRSPGTKYRFYNEFIKTKARGYFPEEEEKERKSSLSACQICGQLTNSKDVCAFCRLIEESKAN